jgi:hypothetical protein
MSEEETDQLVMIQRAVFGKEVEQFMNSSIGRYMLARAAEEKAVANADFLKVNCGDTIAVQAIQNRAVVADSIVGWLKDAVGDGLRALNIIEDRS